ncbi:hypothetical protein [Kitasatospora sp. NPDC005856]|uniref:hypothetical protein n=1 Tax=Kitasatospora sp. NPDC005856 TaxID=3154566 RepID=UPI0033C2B10E
MAVLGTGVELSRAADCGTPAALAGVVVQPVGPSFCEEFAGLVEHSRFPAR